MFIREVKLINIYLNINTLRVSMKVLVETVGEKLTIDEVEMGKSGRFGDGSGTSGV
jgi:hypothetical protein